MPSAFWQAASSCIVPMTLISFIDTRPPACTGVERTPMWTTVSTPAAAMTLPMIGLRMSARTNSAPPMSSPRRHDVDADDAVDVGVVGQDLRHPAAQVPGDTGHEHDTSHTHLPGARVLLRSCPTVNASGRGP